MKLKVDKNICIGCGACQAICPDVFEIEEDGLAAATGIINDTNKEEALDAQAGCPVGAISEVEEETDLDAQAGCPVEAISEVEEETDLNA